MQLTKWFKRYRWTTGCGAGVLSLMGGFLLVIGCCSPGYTPWQRNVVVKGIRFDRLRSSKRGAHIGFLAQPSTIQGLPCQRLWVHFDPEWRLSLCVLAENRTIRGVDFPAGTWLRLDADGNPTVCTFPDDRTVQGHRVRGGSGGVKGPHTGFFPSGRLRAYFARKDVTINGVPCRGSAFHIIGLHENGHLHRCRLAAQATINGTTYRRGTMLELDEHGNVTAPRAEDAQALSVP